LRREDREFQDEIQRSLQPSAPPTVNRLTGQVGMFSLGSMESLLNSDDNERRPLIAAQSFQSTRVHTSYSNPSPMSDEVFLRQRSEHVVMKTFKPEATRANLTNESTV